jgi:hypothetical protein
MADEANIEIFEDETMRFADLVAAAEREARAKVCDDKHHTWRWDDEPDSASGPRDWFGRTDYIVMTRYELERFFAVAYAVGAAAEREMFAKAGIRLLRDDQQQ